MTKEQLARWRGKGFEFDEFYDTIAVDAKPKITTLETLNEIQKTGTQQNFKVKINLDTSIGNNKLQVEINKRVFSTYQKSDTIKELNTFYCDIFVDLSVPRKEETFTLIAKLYNNNNAVFDTKNTTVKVTSTGNVSKANDKSSNVNNTKKDVVSIQTNSITLEQIIAIGVSKKKAIEYIESLNKTLQDYKIDTDLKIINFLAQVMSESGSFNYTSEIGATDAHYKGFKGRGLIQITGIDNYSAYEDYEGEDFTSSIVNKQKLEKSPYAIRSSGWFWSINAELCDDSNKNDFIYCTYKINGGFNGFDSRLNYLKKGFKALNKDYIEFDFQSSKIYNNTKACFAWGLWNDPDIKSKSFDTCKSNKDFALEGYKRFLDLVSVDNNISKWYGIPKLKIFEDFKFVKDKITYVKIIDAVKQRIEKLS